MKFFLQYLILIAGVVLSIETEASSLCVDENNSVSGVESVTSLISNFPNEEEMDSIRAGGVITWKFPDANGATFTFENVTNGPIATDPGKHYYFTDNGVYAGGAFGVYIPNSYSGDTPMPMIFASHGAYGMGPRELENWAGIAEQQGFIAVTPSYSFATNYNNGGDGVVANIEYERNMTAEIMETLLASDLNIDTTRVLATGFSGGGMPTNYMMMRFPQYYTAFCLRSANYLTYYTLDIDIDYWRNKPGYVFWSDNDVSFIPGQGEDFLEAFLKTEDNDYFNLASDTHLNHWNSSNGKTEWQLNSIGHNHAGALVANWFMSLDSAAFSLSDSISLSAQIEMGSAEENLIVNLSDEWEGDTLEITIYSSEGEGIVNDKIVYSGTHKVNISALSAATYTVRLSVGRRQVFNEIEKQTAASVDDIMLSAGIYPNPVDNYFRVSLPNVVIGDDIEVNIFSVNGLKLLSKSIIYEGNSKIDLSSLASGMYVVCIIVDDKQVVKKILKK